MTPDVSPASIRLARIYEPTEGGTRVLVDRLWPRGISKERALWDLWRKDLAPSHDLRKRYHAGEVDFEGFRAAYLLELAALNEIEPLPEGDVVLVTTAKEPEQSHAVVLREWLGS